MIPDNPHQTFAENYISKEDLKRIQKSIEEYLNDNYSEHYVKKIENGVKFEIIIKFAKQEKVDIIVMGTHGRTGIEHVFFGSVAEKVLRHSPFPILIILCKKKLERS